MYKDLTPSSFEIKHKDADGSYSIAYKIPEKFSLWQLSQVSLLIGKLLSESKGAGKVLSTAALSFLQTGDSAELAGILGKLQDVSKGKLFEGVFDGLGEIVLFLASEDRIPQLAATLFLAEDETWLKPATLKERTELMQSIPASKLWEGLQSFFDKSLKPKNSSSSPLQTLETQTSEPENQISETSIKE